MKEKNITHILPSPKLGGAQMNLLLKSNYDKKYNINRKLIYIVSDKGELLNKAKSIFKKYIFCPIVPLDKGYRPYRLFKLYRRFLSLFFVFRLYDVLSKDNSDIVHSEDSLRLFSQFLATYFSGKFFVWQLHTMEKVFKLSITKYLFYFLIKQGLVTIISDSKAAFKSNFPNMNLENCNIISPGIHIDDFINKNFSKKQLRKKFGFKEEDIIIGSTGRLHWSKGYDLLINAINNLKNDNIKLVIAGDGPLKTILLKVVDNLGLKNKVFLLGSVYNIPEFLYILDYYVQPSISEAFGMSVIEAMLTKIPILCSNVGGLSELIVDNKSGFIFEGGDQISLLKQLNKLINTNLNKLNDMVDEGFNKAKKYSAKLAFEKDLEIYNSILKLS